MRTRYLLSSLLIGSACSSAFAGTYSVPLSFNTATATQGDYLAAAFDFGVEFSAIESIGLAFVMPAGYEGTGYTTGNGSYWRQLSVSVNDSNGPIDVRVIPEVPVVLDPVPPLAATPFVVRAGELIEFTFTGHQFVSLDGPPQEPVWPGFAFEGRGQVSFISVNVWSSHPINSGTYSSTTTWSNPGPVVSARLTIVGTPVPEPPTLLLFSAAALLLIPALRSASPPTNQLPHSTCT